MLSTSRHITTDFEYGALEFDQIKRAITQENWSCGSFKDGYRTLANFQEAKSIALDFDGGYSLEQAKADFKDYQHIIATTRNHLKEKDGKPATDRFRVLLFLEESINNAQDFRATWDHLYSYFPDADPACKDASRFYYPSRKIVSAKADGKQVKVKRWVKPEKLTDEQLQKANQTELRGQLARATVDFIVNGAPDGQWNARLTKAAIDLHEQGYTKDELITILSKASGHLDAGDLRCIDSVVAKDPKYDRRGTSFNFQPIEKLVRSAAAVEWVVDGLLYKGSFSILAGPPKMGKSALAKNLLASFATGGQFLGRQILTPGRALYLALEDHPAMISEDFQRLKVADSDLLLVDNEPKPKYDLDELANVIEALDAKIVLIDTLGLFIQVKDLNDYTEVNAALAGLREVARRTGACIMVTHHTNKGGEGTKAVMGSQALFGAVDCLLVMQQEGQIRNVSSMQRGGTPFDKVPLMFNPTTLQYLIRTKELINGFF